MLGVGVFVFLKALYYTTVSWYLRTASFLLVVLIVSNLGGIALEYFGQSKGLNFLHFVYESSSPFTIGILGTLFIGLLIADVIVKRNELGASSSKGKHEKQGAQTVTESGGAVVVQNSPGTTVTTNAGEPTVGVEQANKLVDTVHQQASVIGRLISQQDAPLKMEYLSLDQKVPGASHVSIEQYSLGDPIRILQKSKQETHGSSGYALDCSQAQESLKYIAEIVRELETADEIASEILTQLDVWNNDTAFYLLERLEEQLRNTESPVFPRLPEYLLLAARIHVISAERKISDTFSHITRAIQHLDKIDALLEHSPRPELVLDVKALRGSIENLQNGPESALRFLASCDGPYAIRIRVAIHLKMQNADAAVRDIRGKPPHLKWCDLGASAYSAAGHRVEALALAEWAKEHGDQKKHFQCVVRLADAALARALANQEPGKIIFPNDLSEAEKNALQQVLQDLEPVLSSVVAIGSVDSELANVAVKIGWQAHHLLGHRDSVAELARLMSTHTPVPADVARSVVSGYMSPPSDLSIRLRKDHPNDFNANILAAVVDSRAGQHTTAYQEAKKLLLLADSDEKKEELFRVFQDILQELDEDAASECEDIARSLVDHNPQLQAMFDAARAIRVGSSALALEILDKLVAEDDIYWQQLRGNALLQLGRLPEAVDMFQYAARRTGVPTLLHKTADLAFQAKKTSVSVGCYEALVEAQPGNLIARGNLASLYTFHLRDIGKAAVQFQVLHEAEPENLDHTVNLAVCLSRLYHSDESLALYNEACKSAEPDLRAVLGRAELHLSLGDPHTACASLQMFRDRFWNSPDFLLGYMNIAYAAGDEKIAHEVLQKLSELRTQGLVDGNAFRMVEQDEAIETFKKSVKAQEDIKCQIHTMMLKGNMSWVWAAQLTGDAIYWSWRLRTQDMSWIGDEPTNRASFTVYSTNSFHAQETDDGRRELLRLECPPQERPVVVDFSALITLHRLGLLDKVADYFGEVLVPEGYLETVLVDGKKMIMHQRSRQRTADEISRHITAKKITILDKEDGDEGSLPVVDEYDDTDKHRYRLIDLVKPVHEAGFVDDLTYEHMCKVCVKQSGVDKQHATLTRLQDVHVGLSTLETVASFGLLNEIINYYHISIASEAQTELGKRLRALSFQEETRGWHFDLWNTIRDDERFRFVKSSTPEKIEHEVADGKNYIAFQASYIAHDKGIPLMADERVCQAMTFNERQGATHAAFGSDVFVIALLSSGKMDASRAAEAMQMLMQWRYRFIVPSTEILKAYALKYRSNPPGLPLRKMAEYLQDCMRDSGLFSGPENTDLKDSMALRLYLSWLDLLAEWLVDIWDDNDFSEDTARQFTDWCVQECLPAQPCVLDGKVKVRVGSMTDRLLISHMLFKSNYATENVRAFTAMKAVQTALKLSDEDYQTIIIDILNDFPKKDVSAEEMRNAMRVLQIRMRNTGLGHFERIGLRTLRALQYLNLIDNEAPPIGEHVDLSVLRDLRHVRRQGHAVGPLLLYVTGDGEEKRMLVEFPVLFFSSDQFVRSAALKCLKELTAEDPMALTPKTVNVVENSENGLVSEKPEVWRPAAIAISDALNNDILIALHGVRQSLNSEPVLQDYLNIYTRNLLHPPVSSLDSINLPIGQPERDHEALKKLLTDIIAHALNLTELCNAYFADFGFLPLAPAYSLASAVREWLGSERRGDAWDEVWKWANAESTPIARYHACSVFVLLPNLVPEDKFSDLWNEILAIVGRAGKDDSADKPIITEAWALRLNLARHYTYHLEARLPNQDGANIAGFAWWFAEKVAALFSADEASAKFYRENWIKPATELSSHVWLVASAPITNSFLRYATFVVQSPWAVSLLALMGEHMNELSPSQQSKDVQSRFRDALISNSIYSFPFQLETPIDPTFALECSLADTLNAWEKGCLKEDQEVFRQIVAMGRTLGSKDGLCTALQQVYGANLPDQVAVITALRTKAYSDPSIGEDVWKVVSCIEWRKKVFGNLKKELQDILLEGLSLLMIANREKWHSHFPHYVAELCEQETNEKRKKELFLYVVYLSNASGTVSALYYLLRGDRKADFLEYVKEYRAQVEAMRSDYPPWVAGKLRGLMASMYAI